MGFSLIHSMGIADGHSEKIYSRLCNKAFNGSRIGKTFSFRSKSCIVRPHSHMTEFSFGTNTRSMCGTDNKTCVGNVFL